MPISENLIPSRILVIPDGHRRYAQEKCIGYADAYRLGAIVAAHVACQSAENNLVPHLAFFPLASKNFSERDPATLSIIFSAINDFLDTISKFSAPMRLTIRGTLTRLPETLADRLAAYAMNDNDSDSEDMELQLLIDYDGHTEFAEMTKADMATALANPYDIVVRTGGAFRLSGAPVLECSSADMFSLPMTFPEFTFNDLSHVVRNFLKDKKRRALLRADNLQREHITEK